MHSPESGSNNDLEIITTLAVIDQESRLGLVPKTSVPGAPHDGNIVMWAPNKMVLQQNKIEPLDPCDIDMIVRYQKILTNDWEISDREHLAQFLRRVFDKNLILLQEIDRMVDKTSPVSGNEEVVMIVLGISSLAMILISVDSVFSHATENPGIGLTGLVILVLIIMRKYHSHASMYLMEQFARGLLYKKSLGDEEEDDDSEL